MSAEDVVELNTALMETTFKIGGPAKPPNAGRPSLGTGFVVGKLVKTDNNRGWFVLITAEHVLDGIDGEDLTIVFRKKEPDGTYTVIQAATPLRSGGRNLYVKHQTADVAALYIHAPPGVNIALLDSASWLASDADFKRFQLHPGDELTALGYPLAASSNDWQFPILRSGKIASYPLVPMSVVKTFLFDFHVFAGNSGGPVYFVAPNSRFATAKQIPLGGFVQSIIGLVSQQLSSTMPGNPSLELAVIVPAQFIRETLEILPPEPQPEINHRKAPLVVYHLP